MDTPDDVFIEMVDEYKESQSKPKMIQILKKYCEKESTTAQDIYDLKKMLELNFSKEVDCKYCYLRNTPIDYGCDLREIFYDRDNNLIDGGQDVLNLFNSKKLSDMWHVMTDIDDTLYPNTEHSTYIAGSDKSWKQKTAYPGIRLLYRLLYKKPGFSSYSTILSATPGCLKKSKLKDSKRLLHPILGGDYGFIQGIESKAEILKHIPDIVTNCVGHFCNLNTVASTENISELFTLFGNTKFKRFEQYSTIFPEYKILFIGDNGQGDVLAGKQMIDSNPSCHVFIHKVSEDGKTFKESSEETEENTNLHFFKNYYDLALQLQDIGILDDKNVNEIKKSIIKQIKNTEFSKLYDGLFKGGKPYRSTQKLKRKKSRGQKCKTYRI